MYDLQCSRYCKRLREDSGLTAPAEDGEKRMCKHAGVLGLLKQHHCSRANGKFLTYSKPSHKVDVIICI